MRSLWLRGTTFRKFKKRIKYINNDGVYYKLKDYAQLMLYSLNVKIGDSIYNPYQDIDEKITKIHKSWMFYGASRTKGRVLEIIFETETGYWVYDINERKLCGK